MKEIVGVGNSLFGDDGFGPAVVEHIQENYSLNGDVDVVDAGTMPDYLLKELHDTDTELIVLVDVYHQRKPPGQLTIFSAQELPETYPQRLTHHIPVAGILKEAVSSRELSVWIVSCQPKEITMPEVSVGLTSEVQKAVPGAAQTAVDLIYGTNPSCMNIEVMR